MIPGAGTPSASCRQGESIGTGALPEQGAPSPVKETSRFPQHACKRFPGTDPDANARITGIFPSKIAIPLRTGCRQHPRIMEIERLSQTGDQPAGVNDGFGEGGGRRWRAFHDVS